MEWSHDFAVDVWGFGILLYLLNYGQVRLSPIFHLASHVYRRPQHPFMGGDDATDNSVAMHQKILLTPVVTTAEDTQPFVELIGKVGAST